MIPVPLIHTQFVPPNTKNRIRRTRLLDLGLSILSHRVTTIVAPAGFGKSDWISSLLKERGWPLTAWLSLDHHDKEPSFLLYHLIHSIKFVQPEFGDMSLRTMNSLEDAGRDWKIAVSTLLEEIPQDNEFVLVLDDFHLIDKNNVICDILEYLIRWLPAKTHLVVSSRTTPSLRLLREQLSGDILQVGSEQLLFSLQEIRELFSVLDLQPDEKEIEMIHDFTEGWAVVLRLLGIHLNRSSGNLHKILSAFKNKDSDTYTDTYTYLSKELLDFLPEELQNFLSDSSLLPYLQPELCDAAFQRKDSDAIINELYSLGLLSKITNEDTIWRQHHLMSEFLEQRVTSLHSSEYVLLLKRRAAIYFQHQGEIDRALEEVVSCSDWPTAVDLINTNGRKYFLEYGRQDSLYSWICCLPDHVVTSSYKLLYLKGNCLLHVDSEEALHLLSKSVDLAECAGDIREQIRSLITMLPVYTFTNNIDKLLETADRIPVAASILKDSWTRGIILVAGLTRTITEDNLKLGVWLSRLASKCKLDPEWQMYYLFSSSIIQFRLGNMDRAKQYVEEALALPIVANSDRWTGTAYEILSGIYCDMGDYPKTVELSQELLRLGHKYNISHQLAYAHRRLAKVHQRNDNLVEAFREYELSREDWLNANNILMAHITDLEILIIRALTGEDSKRLLKELENPLNLLSASTGQGYRDYALSLAGVVAREAGELETAQQWLEESSAISAEKGAKQLLAGTQLHLAKLHLLKGDELKADGFLRKALNIAETSKFDVFWDWENKTVYDLCQRALLKQIHPKWALHILQRWFSQRILKEAGYMLVYPDENVRKAISGLLQNMISQTGVPIIHLNCLGGFRLFISGIEIHPDRWKTKKAENLTKYLMINRHHHLKESIIEELWPESEPKLGDASLRMALTHARHALDLKSKIEESIILKRSKIYFNPEIEIYTDYELFISLTQNTLEDSENQDKISILEQAVRLYQGDFLPDNQYDDWTSNIRTRLQHIYLEILLKQISYYSEQGRLSHAIQTCYLYLAVEPTDEQVCRRAMDFLWQNGQKQKAIALFQKFTDLLNKEYFLTPSQETRNLYEKIRCS